MSESAVRLGEAGELLISGVLDYRSGPGLRKRAGPDRLEHRGGAGARLFVGGEVQQRRLVVAAGLHA